LGERVSVSGEDRTIEEMCNGLGWNVELKEGLEEDNDQNLDGWHLRN